MNSKTPWWLDAREQSLLRRKAQATAASGVNSGDAFLIVTEGTVTEPIYFECLRADLQLPTLRIRVQPGIDSDPRHVIQTAADLAKEHLRRGKKGKLGHTDPEHFDHVWAVIDTDVAVRNGIWSEVMALANSRRVKLAYSTPCFEYWLLLHIQGMTTRSDLVDGTIAKSAVKHALGQEYATNGATARKVMPLFIPHWPEAVVHAERVRKYHLEAKTHSPANPSTEVAALVRALNDSAPQHLRRL